MATIYNSSFHCNRIQICETRLKFFFVSTAVKIYRRSILSHVLLRALLLKTVQEISPFPQEQRVKRIT